MTYEAAPRADRRTSNVEIGAGPWGRRWALRAPPCTGYAKFDWLLHSTHYTVYTIRRDP